MTTTGVSQRGMATLLALVGVVLGGAFRVSAQPPQRAFLELVVNEVTKGEVIVVLRGGDVLVRVADLERAGLRGFAGRRETLDGEPHVSLASLRPGVTHALDEAALVLRVTASSELLAATLVDLQPGRPRDIVYSRDPSGFLNYAVSVLDFEDVSAFGEAGASWGPHLLLGSASRTPDEGVVRGLTTYTLDDRARLLRWSAGDAVADAGPLGGSRVIGGLGVAREFGLDPYFVRFPSVGLSGTAVTPSTADVYVNDVLVRQEPLPPGPFTLRNLPVPAGSGQARVVVRDAFGREREITRSFYYTTALLSRGLHDFAYHVGFPRANLGRTSGDYESLAFLGRHRYGVTDGATAGARLEASSDLVSGGALLALRLPLGEIEGAAAASWADPESGLAGSLAYTYAARAVSFGAAVRGVSDDYATLTLERGDDRARVGVDAFVGASLTRRLAVTLQYALEDLRDAGRRERASLLGSLRLSERANLFVTLGATRQPVSDPVTGAPTAERDTGYDVFVGFTWFLGPRTSASLAVRQGDDETTGRVTLQRSLPLGTGFGYRVQATATEDQERAAGVLQYQGPWGRYEAGYTWTETQDATSLSVAGGLMTIGGRVHAARPLQDGYGVVRVPGVAGVRGYLNNQEVGRTDARGDLPVPDLLPYYGNRLRIRDEDIPIDHRVDAVERVVGPPSRGGALVAFPVRRIQAVTGSVGLERAEGLATPTYGQLTVTAAGQTFESPVGRAGEFYFEDLPAGRHPARVEHEDTACEFTLEVPVSADLVVDLGEVRCTAPRGPERTP